MRAHLNSAPRRPPPRCASRVRHHVGEQRTASAVPRPATRPRTSTGAKGIAGWTRAKASAAMPNADGRRRSGSSTSAIASCSHPRKNSSSAMGGDDPRAGEPARAGGGGAAPAAAATVAAQRGVRRRGSPSPSAPWRGEAEARPLPAPTGEPDALDVAASAAAGKGHQDQAAGRAGRRWGSPSWRRRIEGAPPARRCPPGWRRRRRAPARPPTPGSAGARPRRRPSASSARRRAGLRRRPRRRRPARAPPPRDGVRRDQHQGQEEQDGREVGGGAEAAARGAPRPLVRKATAVLASAVSQRPRPTPAARPEEELPARMRISTGRKTRSGTSAIVRSAAAFRARCRSVRGAARTERASPDRRARRPAQHCRVSATHDLRDAESDPVQQHH